MIARTIYKEIELSIKSRPVTLITGARQVGKSTLALKIAEKYQYNYVSLDNSRERELALKDPELFLSLHPFPLIIDEVQRAPNIFIEIENIVNKEKIKNENNYGMYILTGSQIYKLMNNVSESLSGRVSIIHMMPLSRNEIISRDEVPFDFNLINIETRANNNPLNPLDLYDLIVKGFYPELYSNPLLKPMKFYEDYVETYIERDVSTILNVKDKYNFRRFMELLASLTGKELIYDNLAKIIGVDKKTIMSWISVLLAGDIIYLLEPYNEFSITKRIVKRPKLYFSDTGLASYLAKLNSGEILRNSSFSGSFVETYIINELKKSFINNGIQPNFYYYRDSNMNEIDLIIINEGKLYKVECKSGISFDKKSFKSFKVLSSSIYHNEIGVILSNTPHIYKIDDNIYVLPLAGI